MNTDQLLDLFQTKSLKFIAVFAILGIAFSWYVLNDDWQGNRLERRARLLKELASVDSARLSSDPVLQEVYRKTVAELKDERSGLAGIFELSSLPWERAIGWRFLAGGFWFLLLYLIQAVARLHFVLKGSRRGIADLIRHIRFYYILLWLLPAMFNACIPLFVSPVINYILFPSVLTLFVLFVDKIYQEARDKLDPAESSF